MNYARLFSLPWEASSASFHDSLQCTGRFAFENKESKGRRGHFCGWAHFFARSTKKESPRPASSTWITCCWLFLLPPSRLFTPSRADFERGLGPIYKAGSPRSTHLPQCIKLPPLYSRNQIGSYFWPLKISYSVWTQNSWVPPILNLH